MGCNDAYRTKCPQAVNFAETAVSESLARERSIDLDLAEIKRLVKEECPKIPSGTFFLLFFYGNVFL